MGEPKKTRRDVYLALLLELDDLTMRSLKYMLREKELPDVENFITHALNTILENNRALGFSLTRNFSMIAGTSLRNLLENWANVSYVLTHPTKKDHYATAITATAFAYAETLNKYVKRTATLEELRGLPRWAGRSISKRIELLGEAREFQYELLSRYTHTDMWAAIHDEMVEKEKFWTSLLAWGLEFSLEVLLLVGEEGVLADDFKDEINALDAKITVAIAA
jgi:hypothetical protein